MKNEKKSAKPVISLQAYTIENLQYTLDKHVSKSIPVGFHLKPSVAITDDLYHGKLVLDVSLKIGSESINAENNAESKAILITISAFFDVSDDLNDRDEIGRILTVNGTAILFPYVRSTISMITGLDSAQTVLLPTIRTTDLFGEHSIKI